MEGLEVIDAFLDRERVEPEALSEALSTVEGRQYLVDLLALRELTTEQTPAADTSGTERQQSPRRWLTMAAAILLGAAGGYVAGGRLGAPAEEHVRWSPVVIEVVQPVSAPAPTQVIQLKPGPDARRRRGLTCAALSQSPRIGAGTRRSAGPVRRVRRTRQSCRWASSRRGRTGHNRAPLIPPAKTLHSRACRASSIPGAALSELATPSRARTRHTHGVCQARSSARQQMKPSFSWSGSAC